MFSIVFAEYVFPIVFAEYVFSIVFAEYVLSIEMWISILLLIIIIFCNIVMWTAHVHHVDFHVLQNKWYIYIYTVNILLQPLITVGFNYLSMP